MQINSCIAIFFEPTYNTLKQNCCLASEKKLFLVIQNP